MRLHAIRELQEYHFAKPAPLADVLILAVKSSWGGDRGGLQDYMSMKRLSFEEMPYAWILSFYRDLEDDGLREQWVQAARRTPTKYCVMDSAEEKFWAAKNLRQDSQTFVSCRRTTMQVIYEASRRIGVDLLDLLFCMLL